MYNDAIISRKKLPKLNFREQRMMMIVRLLNFENLSMREISRAIDITRGTTDRYVKDLVQGDIVGIVQGSRVPRRYYLVAPLEEVVIK